MIDLLRVAENDHGTFGILLWYRQPFAVSLERQWTNNERGRSCIPVGAYEAVRCRKSAEYGYQDSPKFGDTFVVENVPGRSKILFHKGNLDDDSHGCILVGEQFGVLSGEHGILASKAGFDEFKRLTANFDRVSLRIRSVAEPLRGENKWPGW